MVWGAFNYDGTIHLEFIDTTIDSGNYKKLMEKVILPKINSSDQEFIYQQDNASVHVGGKMKGFFEKKGISVFDWSSCSPGMNPIENIWDWMVRRMYKGGVQF